MTVLFSNFSTTQSDTPIVQPVTGKRIRVLRVHISTVMVGNFQLVVDPRGPQQADLTPRLHAGAYGHIALPMTRESALVTPPGVGLGFTSEFTFSAGPHSVWLWCEFVD